MDAQSLSPKKAIRHLLAVGPLPPPPSGSNVSFQVFCDHVTTCTSVETLSIIDSSPKRIKENTSILTWSNLKQALRQVWMLWQMGRHADAILLFGSNQYLLSLTPLLVLLARLMGKRCFVRSFGGSLDQFSHSLHPLARTIMHWGFGNAHGLLVETQLLYRHFAAIPGIRTHHVTAYRPIPNSITQTETDQRATGHRGPSKEPSKSGSEREQPTLRLLFISWVREEKGVTVLLQSLQRLYTEEKSRTAKATTTQGRAEESGKGEGEQKSANQGQGTLASPAVQCDLFGPVVDEYAETFEAELAKTPWASYCGILPNEKVLTTMGAYDLLVFPTFYQGEGYPGILVEAMIAGLPAITTRFRSIPDMIDHEVNGLLVDPNDPVTLAEAIRTLLHHPELVSAMAEENHSRRQQYDLQTVLPQMIGIMESS